MKVKLTFLYTHGLEAFYILPTLQKNDKLLENICSGFKPHNIIYFDVLHGQIKFSKKRVSITSCNFKRHSYILYFETDNFPPAHKRVTKHHCV